MPITAKLGLQALCQPSAQSPSLIFPTPSTGAKDGGSPLCGPGMEANGPRLAPGMEAASRAGLLRATPQEEKEAGSRGRSLMPVCRHSAHLPRQISHPLLCIPAMEEETGLEGSGLPSYAAGRGGGAEPGGCWGLLCGPPLQT